MAADFVLSASSLNTFLRCAKQWEFAYIHGIKAPPSLRAVRGIAVHRGVEENMRQKIQTKTDLPLQDVLDAYSSAFDDEIKDGYDVRDEKLGVVKDAGVTLTKIYHDAVAPKIQPFLVEHPIQFEINGQPWSGQIDLAEEEPPNLWGPPEFGIKVRDTKTSSRPPKPENYAINMIGYDLGVRQNIGAKVTDIVFDYLVAPQSSRSPYYMEISTGTSTDQQIRAFSALVTDVASNISKGSFPANGLTNPGVCEWCGFRTRCPAYRIKNPNA